jgi:diguanylate cyclase (GGDEF)-like protein
MDDTLILCVDDDGTVLNALRTLLSKSLGSGFVVDIAESGDEALEIYEDLRQQGRELSVIISDYIMPGMRGDELLVRLHELSPNTVKIMLTGQSSIEGIKRAINGANLYRFLEKPFNNDDIVLTARTAARAYWQDRELEQHNRELRRINESLERQVEARTRELVAKNQELERLSITDPLTGLYNRLKLDQLLALEFARSQRYATSFATVILDIDKFKSVNDTYGHQTGDQVLVELAGILTNQTRDVDYVGRWGGEEFLVIASNTEIEGACELAEKLRQKVASHQFPRVGEKTASFGIAVYDPGESIADLMGRADRALYRAKESGRNRVECDLRDASE